MKKLIYSSLLAMLLLGFCVKNATAQEDQKIYSFMSMETPPSYPGGMTSFYSFLNDTMKYPEEAKKRNLMGTLLVSFVVEKDGSLNDIKIDRNLGHGTDEEAVRVLKLSKRWNPGLIAGKPVRVKYNIPVRFGPQNSSLIAAQPKNTIAPGTNDTGEDKIYNFISMETPPSYPGGLTNFYQFISENMKYPDTAVKEKIQGSVLVSFVVQKDGTLNDIKVERKLGFGTDEEAIRVLNLSKRWNPGEIDGKPVNVKYNIPVKFTMK